MENGIERKEVIASVELEIDLKEIYQYSLETFGIRKADEYLDCMKKAIRLLDVCPMLAVGNKKKNLSKSHCQFSHHRLSNNRTDRSIESISFGKQ